mmetsp:Transcript_37994/g.86184  ORF Transcript_37994/g.86184 Transcript_37994/m.86184 type:complete len:158 (-) Transcript_37994:118-591(-)
MVLRTSHHPPPPPPIPNDRLGRSLSNTRFEAPAGSHAQPASRYSCFARDASASVAEEVRREASNWVTISRSATKAEAPTPAKQARPAETWAACCRIELCGVPMLAPRRLVTAKEMARATRTVGWGRRDGMRSAAAQDALPAGEAADENVACVCRLMK